MNSDEKYPFCDNITTNPMVSGLHIYRQDYGHFSRRLGIGPARWPHIDILWVHNGSATLSIGEEQSVLQLEAPRGVLIFAGVQFSGHTTSMGVLASITHFDSGVSNGSAAGGFIPSPHDTSPMLQAMVELSQNYASSGHEIGPRQRLLAAILDGFETNAHNVRAKDRLDMAWQMAEERLGDMRGLSDVAGLIDLSESAFRTLHRKKFGSPAGQHLINLRLSMAEVLLSTTSMSISDIATSVGYAYSESFIHAFRKRRGITPHSARKRLSPFA